MKIVSLLEHETVVGCADHVDEKEREKRRKGSSKSRALKAVPNHAYEVLCVASSSHMKEKGPFLLVHNPWGHDDSFERCKCPCFGREGACKKRTTALTTTTTLTIIIATDKKRPEGLKDEALPKWFVATGGDKSHGDRSGGSFWLSWGVFCRTFNRVHVCVLPEGERVSANNEKDMIQLESEWRGASAGGCARFPSWHENEIFLLKCKTGTDVFVSLSQPDLRRTARSTGEDLSYHQIGIEIAELKSISYLPDGDAKDPPCSPALAQGGYKTVVKSTFWNKRDVATMFSYVTVEKLRMSPLKETWLTFAVVPSTFYPGQQGKFWLGARARKNECFSRYHRIGNKEGETSQELVTLERWTPPHRELVSGRWHKKSAGGPPTATSTFQHNPQYAFTVEGKEKVSVVIILAHVLEGDDLKKANSKVSKSRSPAICLLKGVSSFGSEEKLPEELCVRKVAFTNSSSVVLSAELGPADGPFLLIPCMYKAKEEGSFRLQVNASAAISALTAVAEGDRKPVPIPAAAEGSSGAGTNKKGRKTKGKRKKRSTMVGGGPNFAQARVGAAQMADLYANL